MYAPNEAWLDAVILGMIYGDFSFPSGATLRAPLMPNRPV